MPELLDHARRGVPVTPTGSTDPAALGPCKHCGRTVLGIAGAGYYTHQLDSGHSGKSRCDPDESGLSYGYNAAPRGEPCSEPCMGVRYPDPRIQESGT